MHAVDPSRIEEMFHREGYPKISVKWAASNSTTIEIHRFVADRATRLAVAALRAVGYKIEVFSE